MHRIVVYSTRIDVSYFTPFANTVERVEDVVHQLVHELLDLVDRWIETDHRCLKFDVGENQCGSARVVAVGIGVDGLERIEA